MKKNLRTNFLARSLFLLFMGMSFNNTAQVDNIDYYDAGYSQNWFKKTETRV